ncbi:synaptotagmin-15-like [Sparus aurata]|uniref:synaptotagmin-15-like n=1 Tax=Sparus aurata TaxID=8175 RepID=UPI0011C18BBB|nr:synaptotagmin-15-like [Sparus aurata]
MTGVTVGCWSVCGSPVAAASRSDAVLSVEEEEEEEGSQSVRGAPEGAPPPGMATRLCFSVEYRHSSEQLMVSLLRLGNLPPRFHGNVTLVELRLLPDDRRPQQAKARGTGPDPEFNDCFILKSRTQMSRACKPAARESSPPPDSPHVSPK